MGRRATSINEYYKNPPAVSTTSALRTSASVAVRILGIDPGSRYTGFGIVDYQHGKFGLVAAGRIDSSKIDGIYRLQTIYDGLTTLIAVHKPHEIAIEETFVNRSNPQSALVLGQARGVALLTAVQSGAKIAEYAPTQVKLAVVGKGRADKLQVQQMVKVLLSTKEVFLPDAADALAVAVCHAHVRSTLLASGLAMPSTWA